MNFKSRKIYISNQKKLFLVVGFLNVLFGNILLQILLLKLSIGLSTLISQAFSSIIGYITYGKFVFKENNFSLKSLFYFIILSKILWIINWAGINIYTKLGVSKFFSAILMIPKLALVSYIYQMRVVYKKG